MKTKKWGGVQNTISKYRIREKLQRSTRKRPIEKHQRKEKRNRTICTYPNVCVMLGGLQSQRLKCLKRKSNQIERRFQSIIRFFCKKWSEKGKRLHSEKLLKGKRWTLELKKVWSLVVFKIAWITQIASTTAPKHFFCQKLFVGNFSNDCRLIRINGDAKMSLHFRLFAFDFVKTNGLNYAQCVDTTSSIFQSRKMVDDFPINKYHLKNNNNNNRK